jgi:hypothetical protein
VRGLLIGMIPKKHASTVANLIHDNRSAAMLVNVGEVVIVPFELVHRRHLPVRLKRTPSCITFVVRAQGKSMKIEFMLIADAVESVNGKLYVLGGCWGEHHAQAYPANIRVGIAVSLLVNKSDDGLTPDIDVEIVDASGFDPALSVRGKTELNVKENDERIIIALNSSVPLKQSGRYEVRLKVGAESAVVAFQSSLTVPP